MKTIELRSDRVHPAARTLFMPAFVSILGACVPNVEQPTCVDFDANTIPSSPGTVEVVVNSDQPSVATVVKLTPLRAVSGGFQELSLPATSTRLCDSRRKLIF